VVNADRRYIGIDTTDLNVAGTVQRIQGAIPETYANRRLRANPLFRRDPLWTIADPWRTTVAPQPTEDAQFAAVSQSAAESSRI